MSMTEHPLIVQDWGVRAIRAGTKTQTRRVVIPQPIIDADGGCWYPHKDHKKAKHYANENHLLKGFDKDFSSPYGVPGDNLWVRESCDIWPGDSVNVNVVYRATGTGHIFDRKTKQYIRHYDMIGDPQTYIKHVGRHWRPPIHMPRWASRIDLTVKSERVERVQDITADDCQDEGIERIERAEYEYDDDGAPNNKYWVIDEDAMIESYAEAWGEINIKPRARMRGGEIAFYESFPWDGERETREHRGKPWYVYPNPWVFRIEWPKYEATI